MADAQDKGADGEHWSGRLGFILAAMGSAIGLGSIWKFPYETGSNGGGVFLLFYLLGLALIVLPLMFVEFAIGRRGQSDAPDAIANVAQETGASRAWGIVGAAGVLASALILSFYAVVGGWTLAYGIETIAGGFAAAGDAAAMRARFEGLMASPLRMGGYFTLFMALTAFVVSRGIRGGIERASEILMPLLVVLLILLAAFSLWRGDAVAALRFLFMPDFAKLTARTIVEALGLGLFSIGVGLAVMVTYAAYADRQIDLRQAAVTTIVADTAISILAGLAIFPVVFAQKLDPSGGPGLMFVTIPLAFANVPFGAAISFSFFALLAVAALVSAISLLEMPVSWLHRHRGWSRGRATLVSALACWAAGWLSVLSFNLLSWVKLPPGGAGNGLSIFDALDQLTSNILLPLGGLGLAILAGWILPARILTEELQLSQRGANVLRFLLRYVTPPAIFAAMAFSLVMITARAT